MKFMQKKFYTAKIDAMFKAIFCNPENTNLLKGLIEKCLKKNRGNRNQISRGS